MSKEREAIKQEIAALEAELDRRSKPARQAREKTSGDDVLDALKQLEATVKAACGESFMDDVVLEDESYMQSYMDDEIGMEEDAEVFASDSDAGAEDEIDQDYLDDVLKEEKDPASIVTDPSMLDAAPTGYVARLKSASARLDRVADYCEKQGRNKLAFEIDQISDAIDARIKKEEARDA